MHSSFQNLANNQFDRHFGGTKNGVADPYISGYHFIYFKHLPPGLKDMLELDPADLGISSDISNVQSILSASCMAVTPPGGTLNKAEFTGLGGSKWSVPTNMDYGNTLTIRFGEWSRLPIFQIFHAWFRLIREYRTGTSPLAGSHSYTKSNYAGTVLYWTTKPDGVTVEYSAAYTGVFPTKDPQDSFPGDITASDKLEIDMDFSIDWIWKEKFVRDECQHWANQFAGRGLAHHGGTKVGEVTASNSGQTNGSYQTDSDSVNPSIG